MESAGHRSSPIVDEKQAHGGTGDDENEGEK